MAARQSPHLLRIAFKECSKQPPAETIRHPRFQVIFRKRRRQTRPRKAGETPEGFDWAESHERVQGLQRILEEFPAIVNARKPGANQQIVAEYFLPDFLDLGQFGEEPVAANVKAVAVVFDGAREAPNHGVLFQYDAADSLTR